MSHSQDIKSNVPYVSQLRHKKQRPLCLTVKTEKATSLMSHSQDIKSNVPYGSQSRQKKQRPLCLTVKT